ncbi:MAG: hypothetical protein AAGI66_07850 [Cyanobacteria bacterium P01_H01_bin.74]
MHADINSIVRTLRYLDMSSGDVSINRGQIARAALITPEGSAEQRALATMVLGGRNGTGLLPDFNNDGEVNLFELYLLGTGSGSENIDPGDFKSVFPGQSLEEGVEISMEALEEIASPDPAYARTMEYRPEVARRERLTQMLAGFQATVYRLMYGDPTISEQPFGRRYPFL